MLWQEKLNDDEEETIPEDSEELYVPPHIENITKNIPHLGAKAK